MIPSTVDRVRDHSPAAANEAIRRQTEENVAWIAAQGPRAIAHRLNELDREWDVERTLEANAAAVALIGLSLGRFVDRRFYALPAAVAGFLLQHAVQGWCPPMPVFRYLGVRTAHEIDEERYALKALRGDFQKVSNGGGREPDGVDQALHAVRR